MYLSNISDVYIHIVRSKLKKKRKTADGKRKHGGESIASFTEKEIKLFETTLENRYDLTSDDRYNAWLKTKCPTVGDGLQEPSLESSVCDLSACKDATCGSTGKNNVIAFTECCIAVDLDTYICVLGEWG